MQKIWSGKYGILILIGCFIAVIYVSTLFSYRYDLTAEKRYSLTNATKTLLNSVDSVITILVFLSGDLPADYKKLSDATQELLDEFKSLSANRIRVRFEKPGEQIVNDSAKGFLYDSLAKLGVVFERNEIVSTKKEKETNQLIIPSALVSYRKGQKPIAVDLRSSRKIFKQFNVVNDNSPQEDIEATRMQRRPYLSLNFQMPSINSPANMYLLWPM